MALDTLSRPPLGSRTHRRSCVVDGRRKVGPNMEEGLLTKVWTLLPWVLVLTVSLTLAMPLVHVWSTVSTASFQGSKMAEAGEAPSLVDAWMTSVIDQRLPTTEGGTSLFNADRDVQWLPTGPSEEAVRVTYHWPVFWPVAHLIHEVGPTVPITSVRVFALSSEANQGVVYQV